MVNVDKLKGKIVENRLTLEKTAELIGVDRATFYRKLALNGDTFLIKEVEKLIDVLHLTKDEVNNIFFAQSVA